MHKIPIEKVVNPEHSSFTVKYYEHEFFEAPLHVHPEYELILIEEGEGQAFIGNKEYELRKGDFMLLGPNLPHLWLSSDEYYEKDTSLRSASVYAQFKDNIFPSDNLEMNEFSDISSLLEESGYGLRFDDEASSDIKDFFRKVVGLQGFERLIALYQVLHQLAACPYSRLTDAEYRNQCKQKADDSIIRYANFYMNQNYQENITLQRIADYIGMNPTSLCRYYKKCSGKTLFRYLAELRISYATKLLTNRNLVISQIAYECGYNNISHFNRQFKMLVGKTPSEYCAGLQKKLRTDSSC